MTTAVALRRVEQRPLTYRDLDDLPEKEGIRYEVIDGELYMSSFPFSIHQRVVTRLVIVIGSYLEKHPIGEVLTSGLKVVLDEPTGVGPDLVYIAKSHLKGLRPDGFYGAPDLVVEVTSQKPQLDRVIKYRKYASAGVRNYWIVDPEQRTLEVFALKGREYKLRVALRDQDVLAPLLFPGLEIHLARLWR